MNTKKILSRITSVFKKKPAGEKQTLMIESVWKAEVVIAAVLLSCFLAFDFWLYQNFILSPPDLSFDQENTIPFRKLSIERTVKKIESYADFLKHPVFPFVESPF